MTSKLGDGIMILTSKLVRKVVGFMNKEEILKKSREENKNKDIAELEIINYATSWAYRVGGMLCALIAVLEVIFLDRISSECWLIFFGMLSAIFIVKFIKLRKKHELAIGLIYVVCFVFFAIKFVIDLLGAK